MTTGLTSMIPEPQSAGPRKRILILVHRVPYPPDKGDRIRSYHLVAHLARLGEVDLAFLTDEPVEAETLEVLGRLCRRVEAVPVSRFGRWIRAAWSLANGRSLTEGLFESPTLRTLIGRWLGEADYDAVVCYSSGVLSYVLGRGLESRLVADLVDVDSQKWFDYAGRASGPKAALFRLEGRRVRTLEREAGRARAVVLATNTEAEIYRNFCPDACVEAVSNGVDLDYFQPVLGVEETGGCVFAGQLDYRANVLGLEWFCREVWPLIRERVPSATFDIVGRKPVAAVQRLSAVPGIRVVGPVPDVRPYLQAARIVVVPLPVARGVQNKVLEAMAMGRAVAASPAALEGLALVPGRDALAIDEPDDWSRTIARLWDDTQTRTELGRSARRYVEQNHRWETCLGRFDDLIDGKVGRLLGSQG
ncbi:TIGR03087 family PEP-CTERM/XrtA system glycosyltransferase [Singulisphaera acidiphila]|uniref:Sugar transferase, PEP-CTERM/EpsH1 system associated n=1 Tax=Singulisphaera acidiphila (strain ATCC BAA-1392 / DSM 18658 / VKM B-2454 / MOB10) TaxID=886293 RepID=L0DLQ9_SINAD|nr:TIGR03087 family PEP-CTERM/XrtA system glycosyltransferase [Singulisphaera acidiphila]AGA29606.1 sugar transferase, PEP-CTERM/EpsH1 system associated [Singulisphaera acidiphila DSM 18658]